MNRDASDVMNHRVQNYVWPGPAGVERLPRAYLPGTLEIQD